MKTLHHRCTSDSLLSEILIAGFVQITYSCLIMFRSQTSACPTFGFRSEYPQSVVIHPHYDNITVSPNVRNVAGSVITIGLYYTRIVCIFLKYMRSETL